MFWLIWLRSDSVGVSRGSGWGSRREFRIESHQCMRLRARGLALSAAFLRTPPDRQRNSCRRQLRARGGSIPGFHRDDIL
jgi:hypothetical protein